MGAGPGFFPGNSSQNEVKSGQKSSNFSPFCTLQIAIINRKKIFNLKKNQKISAKFRAGFRTLKFFVRAPGFILKIFGFRDPEPGPRPSLVGNLKTQNVRFYEQVFSTGRRESRHPSSDYGSKIISSFKIINFKLTEIQIIDS